MALVKPTGEAHEAAAANTQEVAIGLQSYRDAKEHEDTQYQHHPPPADSEQFLILSGPLVISASGRPRAPPVSSLRGSIGSGQGRKPTLLYALAGASTSATSARAEPCAGLARIAHLRTQAARGEGGLLCHATSSKPSIC